MISPEHYSALRGGAAIVDRTGRGRLMLTGQDRRAYLQGLLTNDVVALTAGTGCYAAYLTPQGRMIADVRLFELGDALLADVEPEVVIAVRDKWSMFIFSEDVQVADVTGTTAQVGIYGPGAARTLSAALDADSSGMTAASASGLDAMPLYGNIRAAFGGEVAQVLRRDDAGVMGFDVVLPLARRDDLIERLRESGGVVVDSEAVDAVRIEAGVPVFGRDMTEDTIPLEAGIEDRAISQTKGCYVGQEIIIRVLHRGHGRVARKLVGFTFDAGAAPAAGNTVVSGDREIGRLTSVTESPAMGRPIALGYAHRDFVEPGTEVMVKGADRDMAAIVSSLPFVSSQ